MQRIWPNIVVFVAYVATGTLGLLLPYYEEYVTLIWAPSAVALAAVILIGPFTLPGVFLGSFLINLRIEPDYPGPAAIIAAGNTLGPALAGLALTRFLAFRPQLDRLRDALAYIAVGVFGTGVVTSTLGSFWLCAFGAAPWPEYGTVWLTWIGGEVVGLLIVGPLLLAWLTPAEVERARPAGTVEQVAMFAFLIGYSLVVLAFGDRVETLPYGLMIPMAWIVFRGGLRQGTVGTLWMAVAMTTGTVQGSGPFVAQSSAETMITLWFFLVAAGGANVVVNGLLAERYQALDQQRMLVAELDHRVKNTLATIVALTERSRDEARDLEDFSGRFLSRVRSIARTHEGLARSNWQPMDVGDLVATTLASFAGAGCERLQAGGHAVPLDAFRVSPLTMVLHELATNSAKHGAWSRADGTVSVRWERTEDRELRLVWTERGGPMVRSDATRGHGLHLIEGLVGHEMGGQVDIEFREEGFRCTLVVPAV